MAKLVVLYLFLISLQVFALDEVNVLSQKDLDDCKDSRDQAVHLITKYPNATLKGRCKVILVALLALKGVLFFAENSLTLETSLYLPTILFHGLYVPVCPLLLIGLINYL